MAQKQQLLDDEQREFTEVNEMTQFNYLAKEYLEGRSVYIKGLPSEVKANFGRSKELIRLSFPEPLPYGCVIRNDITIFAIVKRYIEITLKKYSFERTQGEFEFVNAKIAKNFRQEPRLRVDSEHSFLAENFRLSQYSINPNMKIVPLCVQLAFKNLKDDILKEMPGCTLEVFDDNNMKRKDIQAIRSTQEILYIENTFKESDFSNIDSAFLNYKDFLGTKFQKEIESLQKERIKSLLVHPVIYTNIKGEKTAVGFIKITSEDEIISTEILSRLGDFSRKLSDQIRDANVHIIKAPQKVTNVSKTGLQIKIKDKDVIDMFQSNSEEIVIDVRPKPTFRFSLFAKVASIIPRDDKTYTIGLQIIGGEERRGISDWKNYIDMLIKNTKNDLMLK